jgi:hypothetical protein
MLVSFVCVPSNRPLRRAVSAGQGMNKSNRPWAAVLFFFKPLSGRAMPTQLCALTHAWSVCLRSHAHDAIPPAVEEEEVVRE